LATPWTASCSSVAITVVEPRAKHSSVMKTSLTVARSSLESSIALRSVASADQASRAVRASTSPLSSASLTARTAVRSSMSVSPLRSGTQPIDRKCPRITLPLGYEDPGPTARMTGDTST